MSFAARPRHPLTGRRFCLSAQTEGQLEWYLNRIRSLRTELRLGLRSSDEIDRELRHLHHGPVTLQRAALAYLERPLAMNTKRGMRSAVDGHLAMLLPKPIAALDAPTVAMWIETLAKAGLAKTTIGTLWRKLRALVRYAQERGWIGAPPWGDWRPSRSAGGKGRMAREATRSVDELVRLAHAARELDALEYSGLACVILVAALLGLRQGELAGLRWDDVEWGPPLFIRIARQWNGAALKMRAKPKRIESIRELAIALLTHRAELAARRLFAERGPIFPGPSSEPGRPRAYEKGEVLTRLKLRTAVARAGLPNVEAWSAHSLRDSFVTLEAAAAGGDLVHVQSRSRHASLASLVRYLRAMHRNRPASPALLELPGLESGDAGFPVHALLAEPAKETPP